MADYKKFLESKRKEIVEFIDKRPPEFCALTLNGKLAPIIGDALSEMIFELRDTFPTRHDGKLDDIPDKLHVELAKLLLEAEWLGCLSQMKENRGAYSKGNTDTFKKMICEAYDEGRRYAPIREPPPK